MTTVIPEEVKAFLHDWLGQDWRAAPLYGDASARSYFRIAGAGEQHYMVAWYPPEVRPDLEWFLRSYQAITGRARVPECLRSGSSAVAQVDVGDETLYEILHRQPQRGAALYRDAIDLLVAFQRSDPDAQAINPPFDRAKFMDELLMTEEYYVTALMGSRDHLAERREMYEELCEIITHHPYILCHRDYHGQNIHVVNDVLYMIDYQDLRMGPDTYDMASLLRDRGVARLIGTEAELELLVITARSPVRQEQRRSPEALSADAAAAIAENTWDFRQPGAAPRAQALPRLHPSDARVDPVLRGRTTPIRSPARHFSDALPTGIASAVAE